MKKILSDVAIVFLVALLFIIGVLAGSCAPKIPPSLEAYEQALKECQEKNEILIKDRSKCEEQLLDASRFVH